MRQSTLFTKTRKEAPSDEVSKNAQLLVRAGFVNKEMAGAYSYLPLGLRVLEKIKNIIREEMNAVGAHELLLTTLQEPEKWKKTDRWSNDLDDGIWFKTKMNNGAELGLAFTHEEPLAKICAEYVQSYKDLPFFVYQIQTKFRNELRAKSGIMRGREFPMKDMYSFTKSEEETEAFHEKAREAYMNVFSKVGIGEKTFLTISNGGSFSKYSQEFQTLSEAGEDVICLSKDRKVSVNKDDYNEETIKDFGLEGIEFEEVKSIEVGDIYKLGTRYSEALGLVYKDEKGERHPVNMGSYGIGVSRLMGTIVEVLSDEKGIVWPESVAPFRIHLVALPGGESEADDLYKKLTDKGVEVLYDDREAGAGEKFADSDLIGIPFRAVVSKKTVEAGNVEIVERRTGETRHISPEELLEL